MAAISSFQNMAASGVGVTSLFFAVPRASVRHAALGASYRRRSSDPARPGPGPSSCASRWIGGERTPPEAAA